MDWLLDEACLVNLVAVEEHSRAVMDASFANQALSVEFTVEQGWELENRVYPMPEETDLEIARLKLQALSIEIDILTEEQEKYLHSWKAGT
jgi:adenosylhomocysteinase